MRVLFVSYLGDPSASGRQRADAMRMLGHDVVTLGLDGHDVQRGLTRRLRRRVFHAEYARYDQDRVGRALVATVKRVQPDVVWLEKPLMLLPDWLQTAREAAPKASFVCFQDDDPFGSRVGEQLSWRHFVEAIPIYDLHFVKKQVNVEEFLAKGARRVSLFMHGVYAPWFHPRRHATGGHDVLFVGTPLDHRVGYIDYLLSAGAIPVHVHGNSWRRTSVYWRHRRHFHPEVAADAYGHLLSASRICLGFVSSSNRDEYSMRSFEIPGSCSFLLAQRTPAHESLFEEGSEAEFFDSPEECAEKCNYYLRNDTARQRVAQRGYDRCVRSDYFLPSRIADALREIKTLVR
jgi:spore maturation protein CgeB